MDYGKMLREIDPGLGEHSSPPAQPAPPEPPIPDRAAQLRDEAIETALSDRVRDIYCMCRREATGDYTYGLKYMPTWDGGVDAFGKKHVAVWLKIAAKLTDLGADPFDYVSAQFHGEARRLPVQPNMLLAPAAEARWRAAAASTGVTDAALRLKLERELVALRGAISTYMRADWPERRAVTYALASRYGPSISNLLRYIVAVENGLEQIAAHFMAPALLSYLFQQRAFDSVLGGRIPEAMRQEAGAIRERLGGIQQDSLHS